MVVGWRAVRLDGSLPPRANRPTCRRANRIGTAVVHLVGEQVADGFSHGSTWASSGLETPWHAVRNLCRVLPAAGTSRSSRDSQRSPVAAMLSWSSPMALSASAAQGRAGEPRTSASRQRRQRRTGRCECRRRTPPRSPTLGEGENVAEDDGGVNGRTGGGLHRDVAQRSRS